MKNHHMHFLHFCTSPQNPNFSNPLAIFAIPFTPFYPSTLDYYYRQYSQFLFNISF